MTTEALKAALEAHHPTGCWKQPCGNFALVCRCGEDLWGVTASASEAAWRLHVSEALRATSQPVGDGVDTRSSDRDELARQRDFLVGFIGEAEVAVERIDMILSTPTPTDAGEAMELPKGFKPWHGGTAPDDAGNCCETIRANGSRDLANRRSIMWGRPKNKGWEGRAEDHWIIAYKPPVSAPTTDAGEALGRFGHHPDAAIDYGCEVDELIAMAYDRLTGMQDHPDLEDRVRKAMEFRTASTPLELRWLNQHFNGAREVYAQMPECIAKIADKIAALSTPTPTDAVGLRERIAGIIQKSVGGAMMLLPGQSLIAADEILAALTPSPVAEGRE